MTRVPLALVTGPMDHVGSAGAALGRAGFDVMSWEVATPPAPAGPNRRSFAGIQRKSNAGSGPDRPLDCYVQLPCRTGDVGGSAQTAGSDLLDRIDALAAVAARLGPTASVLLGVDETDPAPVGTGRLAPDLLAAVALALLEDLGRPAARVAVLPVADLCRAPVGAD